MSNHEKTKWVSFTAITALAGLLIVIVSAHTLFSELLFYSIVMVLIGVIVILIAYAFLWQRSVSFIRSKIRKRKDNRLAREYFDDLRDFVERFTRLREFGGASTGITNIRNNLLKKAPTEIGVIIDKRMKNFDLILRNPLNSFQQRLNNLHWNKNDINYDFMSSLAREFENYVALHKHMYVDFAVTMAREIGLKYVSENIKRSYSDYKDDYNQFIIAYTEFAKKSTKARLGIFNEHLQKANAL